MSDPYETLEYAMLGARIQERAASPNTPKPEVEQRLRAATMRFDWSDIPDDECIPAVPLLREAADAISRLTAERDAAESQRDAYEAEANSLREVSQRSRHRAEAAEKRVKELEAERDKIVEIALHNSELTDENKLLSERVAVLETALEPFARLDSDPRKGFSEQFRKFINAARAALGWEALS